MKKVTSKSELYAMMHLNWAADSQYSKVTKDLTPERINKHMYIVGEYWTVEERGTGKTYYYDGAEVPTEFVPADVMAVNC